MPFSPGCWYKTVPKDPCENLRFRRFVLERARKDRRVRRGLVEACSQDLLFYINTFVWQYNPRKVDSGEVGPFITWPFQDEAFFTILDCIEKAQDLCVEKSREMGATWMFLIVMDWLFLFHPWKKFLCISRNADAVDCEDPDSLFWKIDFMHDRLPDFLLPGGNRQMIQRNKFYYGNLPNGSSITGQASTGRAGVGGRATCMFVDEFTQIREDREVLHRTSDTTGCRLFNFTHLGTDTAAYEIVSAGSMRKLRLHWSQHPDKVHGLYKYDTKARRVEVLDKAYEYDSKFNFVMDGKLRSPWYDEQCRRKASPRAVAMDLDIDPRGSVSQFVDPMVIDELIGSFSCDPYWEGELCYDPDTGRPYQDPLLARKGGPLKLWLTPDGRGALEHTVYGIGIDIAEGTGATPSCLTIMNKRGDKVGEYVNRHIKPEDFAVLAVAMARVLTDSEGETARLAWEACGPGDRFGKVVTDRCAYRRVYMRTNEQALAYMRSYQDVAGWYPTAANRTQLLGEYRRALYNRNCINRSGWSLEEFKLFRYDARGEAEYGGSASDDHSGAGVNHGDVVISDALAWKMVADHVRLVEDVEQPEIKVGSLSWRRDVIRQGVLRQHRWS
jgi:hypothetical protein